MAEYSDIERAAGGSEKGLKCSIGNHIADVAKHADEFFKIDAANQVGYVQALMADIQRPFSTLDFLQIKEQKEFGRVIRDLETKAAQETDQVKKLDYINKIDEAQAKLEELPGLKAKAITVDANQVFTSKVSLYLQEPLDRMSRLNYSKSDFKKINSILGDENDKLTADYLTGITAGGEKIEKNLITDIRSNGIERYKSGELSTGSKELDSYIKEKGTAAVNEIYTFATAYRKAGQMVGLPEGRFLKNYAPNLRDNFNLEIDKKLKRLEKTYSKEIFDKKIKPFYEQVRTTSFEATDRDPRELFGIYMSMARKKMSTDTINQLNDLRFDPKVAEQLGKDYDKFDKAVDTILSNINHKEDITGVGAFLEGTKRAFYAANLVNNVGSTMTNLTTIPNLVASKYGAINAVQAVGKANEASYLNEILDAFGIGSSSDALSVVDIMTRPGTKTDAWLQKYNIFNISEQFNIKVAAIAGLAKHYGSMDNLMLKVDQIQAMPANKLKDEAFRKLAGVARVKSMDVIFNTVHGNVARIDTTTQGMSSLLSAFLKHPMREANMLQGILRKEDPVEAAQQLGRYFFAKSMLLGRYAPYALIPGTIMSQINSRFPEFRKEMDETAAILDTIAIPKMLFNKVGIDLSLQQDVLWVADLPFQFASGNQNIPSVKYLSDLAKATLKLTTGKGDMKDGVKVATSLAWVGGVHRGVWNIFGMPIGASQLKKIGESAVDLYKGETDFFGVDRKLMGTKDEIETVVSAFSPSTPTRTKTILAKKKTGAGYGEYLASLAMAGETDPRVFKLFAEGKNMSIPDAKESLRTSINRLTEGEKSSTLRNYGRRTVNGY